MAFKIYTKTGDKGTTSLIGGSKVSKSAIQIEAYGTVDELNSTIGVVLTYLNDDDLLKSFHRIQSELFDIGALLAEDKAKNKMELPQVNDDDVEELEQLIDKLDKNLPALKNFILPGGHISAGHAHIARCVCRRAERRVVALTEEIEVNAVIIRYLNRLSDLLFVLARKLNADYQQEEVKWVPKLG